RWAGREQRPRAQRRRDSGGQRKGGAPRRADPAGGSRVRSSDGLQGLGRGALGGDAARGEHQAVVGAAGGVRVVGGVHDGGALRADLVDQVEDRLLGGGVQAGGGLVQQ